MNRSPKRPVFAIRYFPPGLGTQSNPRTSDVAVKNPRIIQGNVVAAVKTKGTYLKQDPEFENSDHALVVPAFKPEGTSSLKHESEFRNRDHGPVIAAFKLEGTSSLKHKPDYRKRDHHGPSVAAFKPQRSSYLKVRTSDDDLSPREKVLEVLRLYKDIFRKLDLDKSARRDGDPLDARRRVDLETQTVIEEMGKQLNTKKMIGTVPGIEVGDEFQYKTELRIVGLHFKTLSGIDYMTIGDDKIATSIVSSEGYGYNDKFEKDVVLYTGEGGNLITKDKETDQKLVKGNLALANSMRKKSEVRVIRGKERLDKKGKRYIYDGLYLVDSFWLEKGVSGKSVYKFKLCKIPGQRRLA